MGSCKWKVFSQKKQEQTLIAIIIGFIHITGILTFELFEGDFNNDKIIDKLKKGIEVYQTNTHKNRLLVFDVFRCRKI